MKRTLALVLALLMCISLCACGGAGNATDDAKEPAKNTPSVDAVVNGIKNEFKDPDSVQLSDAVYAYVEGSDTEYYVIGTVRAKNSFGGYADPVTYVIHCKNGNFRIVEEYRDASYMTNRYLTDLGCEPSMRLH